MPSDRRGVSVHRPRPPDRSGLVVRDGVEIAYDVYDADRPTVLLMPTWSIVDSRFWKLQVPYLARHFRVVTFDGRGSGRSGPPGRRGGVRRRRVRRGRGRRPRRDRRPTGAVLVGLLLRRDLVGARGRRPSRTG